MKEFINICQGGVSVRDYSLKFNKLSKYAPSLVSNPRDKMSHFLIGVFKVLVEEYHFAMLHAQQVEYRRLNTMSREAKKAMSYEGCSSKGRLDIYDNPRFKKEVSNPVPKIFPKARDYRVSNPQFQKGTHTISPR